MLVLSRKRGESIIVGDCEVTVSKIIGNKVQLAVKGPRDIPVHRREIHEAILQSNLAKAHEAMDAAEQQ